MTNCFKHNISLIFLFDFLNGLKFFNAIGIIIFTSIAGSYTLGMSVFSVIALTAAMSEIPTGVLSDWMGRKSTMVVGALCSFLAVLLFSLASDFMLLCLGGIFMGISQALFSGNNSALLFDTLKACNNLGSHHKTLGICHTIGYFSMAASSLICAIVLYLDSDFMLLLWLTLIPQGLAFFTALAIKDPKIISNHENNLYCHLKRAFSLIKNNQKAKWLTLAFINDCSAGYAGYKMITAFINSIIPTWSIGIFETIFSACGAAGAYISSSVMKKTGYLRGLVYGTFFAGVFRIFSVFLGAVAAPILFVFSQCIYSVTDAAQQHLLQMEYTDEERATIGSITSLISCIVWSMVGILTGWLADMTNVQTALVIVYLVWMIRIFLFRKALKQN
jgi:MFS family permease